MDAIERLTALFEKFPGIGPRPSFAKASDGHLITFQYGLY